MGKTYQPIFRNKFLPYLLILPQLALAIAFFLWPAAVALYQSVTRTDPFGLKTSFVGLAHFKSLFLDSRYLKSLQLSFIYAIIITVTSIGLGLLFAIAANDKKVPAGRFFRTILIWPYALAPSIAAVLWLFLFQPSIGLITKWLKMLGVNWNYTINSSQALALVSLVAVWQRLPYNFIFLLAALQGVPVEVIEAARLDGASARRIFWAVVFPLISPVTFFLCVVNMGYAFFDTFGIVDALTKGGPAGATEFLCYKVYRDGFVNLRLSISAAQSVILIILGIILTIAQFRFGEKRVHYE